MCKLSNSIWWKLLPKEAIPIEYVESIIEATSTLFIKAWMWSFSSFNCKFCHLSWILTNPFFKILLPTNNVQKPEDSNFKIYPFGAWCERWVSKILPPNEA